MMEIGFLIMKYYNKKQVIKSSLEKETFYN